VVIPTSWAGALSAAVALGLAGAAILLSRRYPRAAFVVWLCVVAFVPVWFGVSVGGPQFQPASLLGIPVAIGMALNRPRFAWIPADVMMVALLAACVVPVFVGAGTVSSVFGVISQWAVAFTIGRLAPLVLGDLDVVKSVVTVVFAIVGLLAVVEFALDWHPYVGLGPQNAAYAEWGEIQGRSGLWRSEGAFGHSIALGCSLALAIPLGLTSRFRASVRVTSVALMVAGAVVTLSRTGLLCTACALLLSVVFLREPRMREVRGWAVAAALAGALAVIPFVSTVLAGGGREASSSAEYRVTLAGLVSKVAFLGLSPAASRSVTGEVRFAGLKSIDNEILYAGLTYGALAVAIGLVLLLLALGRTLLGIATAPEISVVAMVPALLTVAFITQYTLVFWFMAGLAVAAVSMRAQTRDGQRLAGASAPPRVLEPARARRST